MENKVIWSIDGGYDDLVSSSREDKLNYLKDMGWEEDRELSDDELDNAVLGGAEYLFDDAITDFDENIRPMIERQTRDGIVLLSGTAGTWRGNFGAGKAVMAEKLLDAMGDVDKIEIVSDESGALHILGHHHDGTHNMGLYALPEDDSEMLDFVKNCMPEYLEADIEPETDEDIIDNMQFLTVDDFDSYIDFSKVPEFCGVIEAEVEVGESLNEEEVNEVKAKDPRGLKKELKEIKSLADEYGYEYFTSMPFTSFDNDPTSLEYQYPNFFLVAKAFFKEMGIADNPDDTDELDDLWDSNIDQHDWDTIVKVATIISDKPGKNKQFEKVFKDGQSDGLDDDQILADREGNMDDDEFGESLDEDSDLVKYYKRELKKALDDSDSGKDIDRIFEIQRQSDHDKRLSDKEHSQLVNYVSKFVESLDEGKPPVLKGEDPAELALEDPGEEDDRYLDESKCLGACDDKETQEKTQPSKKEEKSEFSKKHDVKADESLTEEKIDEADSPAHWPGGRDYVSSDELKKELL